MAKEKIISISTGQAVKNIGELRENIKYYKKALDEADLSANEHQAILTRLQENQAALRNAMHATTAELSDITRAATAANVTFDNNNKLVKAETLSYNELVRELDILKQQWRTTTNAAERSNLTERINAVNNQLKGMDASVGVFGRNVGNYIGAVDHLTQGLQNMGGGAARMVNPLKNVTMGFKTLSATPAIAILGLLANVLTKIIDGLKTSEENTKGLTQALAPFEAIGDAVTKMLQGMGKALVSVVDWFGKLTAAIFKNNDASNERLRIAKEQAALDQSQRETLVKNAEAERDIAELRAKASEKDKYTATERLAMLEEAGRLEAEIAERAREDAKKTYEIIRDRNALTESSKEAKEEEARAYADMVKADTAYFQQIRTINQGITRARREEAKDARDAAKAVKDAATAKIAAEKEYLSQLLSITRDGSESQLELQNKIAAKERDKAKAEAVQKIKDRQELNAALALIDKSYQVQVEKNQQEHDKKVLADQALAIRNRAEAFQKGSVEYAAAMAEAAALERDQMRRQMDESDAEFQARRLAAQRAAVEAQQAVNDALLKETTDGLKAQMAGMVEGSVEQLEVAAQIARENLAAIYQGVDESMEEFQARRIAAEKAVRQAEDAVKDGQLEKDRTILEQRMALLEEGSVEYLTLAMELKQTELEQLHQMEGESNEAFRLRELQAEKAYADSRKAIWQASLNIMQQAAGGITSIMGTIADAYESNTEMTKEEAEKAKNLRIAGATIDMLQGAVTAYSGAQSLGVPMGPIIGAINAAAVVATGIANIAKIRATPITTNGAASTSAPAVVPAPSVTPEVSQVRTITGASEEERLNQMASDQRVYILDSDIQAKNDQRRVEIAETTW